MSTFEDMMAAAFEAGATSVSIHNPKRGNYTAFVSADRTQYDDGRTKSEHASAMGHGSTPTEALLHAMQKIGPAKIGEAAPKRALLIKNPLPGTRRALRRRGEIA